MIPRLAEKGIGVTVERASPAVRLIRTASTLGRALPAITGRGRWNPPYSYLRWLEHSQLISGA